MKVSKSALIRLFSDLKRKELTDAQFRTLIESLWRDQLALYAEKFNSDPELDEFGEPIDPFVRSTIASGVLNGLFLGQSNLIESNRSTAIGQGLNTKSFIELLLGSYATIATGQDAAAWVATDRLAALGNGTDTATRSNAFEVYKSGLFKHYNAVKIGDYSHGAIDPENGMLRYNSTKFQGYTNNAWANIVTTAASETITGLWNYTTAPTILGNTIIHSGNLNTAGIVLINQSTPQTLGATGQRLAKLWATDIESTNINTSENIGAENITLDASFGSGPGWTFSGGKWVHGAGFTPLASTWTPNIGTTYKITITTSGWTGPAGGVMIYLGGSRVGGISDNVTSLTYYITAISNDPIKFIPTPDTYGTTYNGSISSLSVKEMTGGSITTPLINVNNINLGTGLINFTNSSIHEYFYGYDSGVGSTGTYSNGFGLSSLLNNTGVQSNGFGLSALNGNTGDHSNAIGSHALQDNYGTNSNSMGLYSLYGNLGNYSTASGNYAGFQNTKNYLSAFGANAAKNNTGENSSMFGYASGEGNTADNLTAFGYFAAYNNTGLNGVTAIGAESASHNTGQDITATGYKSLYYNTGYRNTAGGYFSLLSNTGNYNTAFGWCSLSGGTNTGNNIVAIGAMTLYSNTSGSGSVGLGNYAGYYATTQGNELFIDNQDRGSRAGDVANSLIYGQFAASTANQKVRINGNLGVGITPSNTFNTAVGNTGYNTTYIEQYSAGGYSPIFNIGTSKNNTIGVYTTTTSGMTLGSFLFSGVGTSNNPYPGASIYAEQYGTSGTYYVPANLKLTTYTATGENANQLVLHTNGSVYVGYATDPTLGNKLAVNGNGYINGYANITTLAGTGTRFVGCNAAGQLTTVTETDPVYTSSTWYTTTNNSGNWNTAYGWGNHASLYELLTTKAVQALSGTTPAWSGSSGINATITLSGNTTITLSNLVAGQSGNLTVTNPATVYTLTFSGYSNKISPAIYSAANQVFTSGGSKVDVFSWYYDGTYLIWNGTQSYN